MEVVKALVNAKNVWVQESRNARNVMEMDIIMMTMICHMDVICVGEKGCQMIVGVWLLIKMYC